MPSPFPGMDPYLERHWRDVHQDMAALARGVLNRLLPDDLIARLEERPVVDHIEYPQPRSIYPDVRIYKDPEISNAKSAGSAMSTLPEPILLEFESEEYTEPYIVITDRDGELITAIEFLSPSNKLPGPARDQYRQKRAELLAANAHVVEIDLVRQGRWRDLLAPVVAPEWADTAYRVLTWNANPDGKIALYPLSLRNRLPAVPIPLRPTDHLVELELQPLIDQVYINGKYSATNYNKPCDPPLQPEDAVWEEELLKSRQVG